MTRERKLRLTLRRPLTSRERVALERALLGMLTWQRDLGRWPALADAPRQSMPFVSLYAHGKLVGCMGHAEGAPGERVARAFLDALADARFPGPSPDERPFLSAQVAYVRDVAELRADDAMQIMEAGAHGIGVLRDGAPVILLPQVARDEQLDPERMLQALAHKSGIDVRAPGALVFLFRTEEVASWSARPRTPKKIERVKLALSWLARLVKDNGSVAFAIDARRRVVHETGPMNHGRAAVVIRALDAGGAHPDKVAAARLWLTRESKRALAGRAVPGFSEGPAQIAGTLALAVLAGARLEKELLAFSRANEALIAVDAWHAGQVVAALGLRAPEALWRACTRHLGRRAWAPWTVLGAAARGDEAALTLTTRELVRAIRAEAPHAGGVDATRVPETALTAITVEALLASRDAEARSGRSPARDTQRAIALGRAFLDRWQLLPGSIPAALDPDLALGAFPASPIVDLLRGDIVAHAVLALMQQR